jgi:hypothetical protein
LFCSNPSVQEIIITISAIEINIYSSTNGSYLIVYDKTNKKYIEENQDINLGKIEAKKSYQNQFAIYNFGSQNMFISKDGIQNDLTNLILTPKIDNLELSIPYNKSLEIPFVFDGPIGNSTYQSTITLQTTANNLIAQFFQFTITYTTNVDATGKIAVFYGDLLVEPNSNLSLYTLPQGLGSAVTLKIKNIGTAALAVQNVQLQGMLFATLENSLENQILSPQQELNFNFLVNDTLVGNGSGQISINNSDANTSRFVIKTSFVVKENAKLEIRDGISSDYTDRMLEDNKVINFGTLNKNRIYQRFYNVSNTGVNSSIRVDSIQSNSSDARIMQLPTLPYILEKDSSNFLNFAVLFDTISGVNKQADIIINYTVL